jgi:hypothetical protein
VHIYVNGKLIPVETVPGMGEGRQRRAVEEDEFKDDVFDAF